MRVVCNGLTAIQIFVIFFEVWYVKNLNRKRTLKCALFLIVIISIKTQKGYLILLVEEYLFFLLRFFFRIMPQSEFHK